MYVSFIAVVAQVLLAAEQHRFLASDAAPQFTTIVNLEFKGGFDTTHMIVRRRDFQVWCTKRPTITRSYCVKQNGAYIPNDKTMKELSKTNGTLWVTDLFFPLLPLWEAGNMGLAASVGRWDHARSHFAAREATSKGVSVQDESHVHDGWLADAISASKEGDDGIDVISFGNAAQGPTSCRAAPDDDHYNHLAGVGNWGTIRRFNVHNYTMPDDVSDGLHKILDKEAKIFKSVDELEQQVEGYERKVRQACPDFPATKEWGSSRRDTSIGRQFMYAAMAQVVGVNPHAFQLMQGGYDTHSDQVSKLRNTVPKWTKAVVTYMKALELCSSPENNLRDNTLVASLSDFGRRFAENSRGGTDHGNGAFYFLWGTNLQKQLYTWDRALGHSSLPHDLPSYLPDDLDRGDLRTKLPVSVWSACMVHALGLKMPLRFLPTGCPAEIQIRSNLPAAVPVDDTVASVETDTFETVQGDAYLTETLTNYELLNVARSVTYSPKNIEELLQDGPATLHTIASAVTAKSFTPPARPIYTSYRDRRRSPISLRAQFWRLNPSTAAKQKIYDMVGQLVYPKNDTLESRLERFNLQSFFDVTDGKAVLKNATEDADILSQIKGHATDFFTPKKNKKQDWTTTIMNQPDVKLISTVTALQVVDDWKCKTAGCDTTCDLENLLVFDHDKREAWLKDPESKAGDMGYKRLKSCTHLKNISPTRSGEERQRSSIMRGKFYIAVESEIWDDATKDHSFHAALCSRMSSFFRNMFAAPQGNVPGSRWQKLYMLEGKFRDHCLGNYRDLIHALFKDAALTSSLNKRDPLQPAWCKADSPDENFAREWFERFQVGVDGHNQWDIQALAKALNPGCCSTYKQQFSEGTLGANLGTAVTGNKCQNPGTVVPDVTTTDSQDACKLKCEASTQFGHNFNSQFPSLQGISYNEDTKECLCCSDMTTVAARGWRTNRILKNHWMPAEGMILKSDATWCLESEQDVTDIVDLILESGKTEDQPATSAKFLCRNLFSEFAGVTLAMDHEEVKSCGGELSSADHEWSIPKAIEFVLESPVFYANLGSKQRWAANVLIGAEIDLGLNLRENEHRGWLNRIGQAPFMMPDVGGYIRSWQDKHLMEMHRFFNTRVYRYLYKTYRANVNDFLMSEKDSFSSKFSEFLKSGTPATYSYAHAHCTSSFVEVAGQEGKDELTEDDIFWNRRNWKNWRKWMESLKFAVDNPCQLIA